MDKEGYPSSGELRKVREWKFSSGVEELFVYIEELWHWPDMVEVNEVNYDDQFHKAYTFHTGGWSGNEELMEALRQNWIIWSLTFYSEVRGGHFEFKM